MILIYSPTHFNVLVKMYFLVLCYITYIFLLFFGKSLPQKSGSMSETAHKWKTAKVSLTLSRTELILVHYCFRVHIRVNMAFTLLTKINIQLSLHKNNNFWSHFN